MKKSKFLRKIKLLQKKNHREHMYGDRRLSCVFGDLTKLERQYLNEKK